MAKGETTTDYTYYDIERVWLDMDYVYIVYRKKRVVSRYSPEEIHGTVIKEEADSYLSRLPRANLADSQSIGLSAQENASSVVYRDGDFNIVSTDSGVTLSGKRVSTTFPKCSAPVWSGQEVIRVQSRLLYCGVLFDPAGNRVQEVPTAITSAIEAGHEGQRSSELLFPLTTMSVISNGSLLTMGVSTLYPTSELDMQVWPMTQREHVTRERKALPVSSGGYKVQVAWVYSPANFVLRPVVDGDHWALLCNENKCERITVHQSYSALLVDAERRQVIEISPRSMNVPSTTLYVSSY